MQNLRNHPNIVLNMLNCFTLKIIYLQTIIYLLKLKDLFICKTKYNYQFLILEENMKYDTDTVMNVLRHLKEDPMRIIFTEHFLNQIEKRNIPDILVEDLLENRTPVKINKIQKHPSKFELCYNTDGFGELSIIITIFNLKSIILLSAAHKNRGSTQRPNINLEVEGIYDLAFDLMDLHSKEEFEYNQTIEVEPRFNIDFDSTGHPVAIEIIYAAEKFKLKREAFSSAAFKGLVEITPDSIKIRLEASLNHTNIKTRVIEKEIANDYGIPGNVFELTVEMLD